MNGIWQDYIGQLIEDKVEDLKRGNPKLSVLLDRGYYGL